MKVSIPTWFEQLIDKESNRVLTRLTGVARAISLKLAVSTFLDETLIITEF